MNEAFVKRGDSLTSGYNQNRNILSLNIPTPSEPVEAIIFIGIAGFFFYFSPDKNYNSLGFLSALGIYVSSLLGIYLYNKYTNASARLMRVLFFLCFFLSTLWICFYFFVAFFAFLRQIIDYFQLSSTLVTAGYLTAAILIILAWAALKNQKNN